MIVSKTRAQSTKIWIKCVAVKRTVLKFEATIFDLLSTSSIAIENRCKCAIAKGELEMRNNHNDYDNNLVRLFAKLWMAVKYDKLYK